MDEVGLELLQEFLAESYEGLDRLDNDFVSLESDPQNYDRLNNVFRTIHTIKGTCGFLGLPKLEALTHAGETLLVRLRDGEIALEPRLTTALLAMVDAVRALLGTIERTHAEGDSDHSALASRLVAFAAAEPGDGFDDEPAAVTSAVPAGADLAMPDGPGSVSPVGSDSIRVNVSLLDSLVDLVGELVLARNQLLQCAAGQEDMTLTKMTQRLNLITSELQESVMKTRMQPIGNIWKKFPRIVRDLAHTCDKRIRLLMEGDETELDRTLIEAIRDPLTHMLRNAADHGIESSSKRRAEGKAEEGLLHLRAYHEGGQVNIELTDDGAGIDVDLLRDKAVTSRLLTPLQAARLSAREALDLVFEPGLTTAREVTNVSGRGVGMDVVRTNIEKIGGSIDLASKPGVGTTIRIKIPLTLAIIPALLIRSGHEEFAIPQVSLLELVRLEADEAVERIERIAGAHVYRLRGRLLPLVYLNRELGLEEDDSADASTIVVLRADDREFGLVVDHVRDTEEIVVKPLAKQLQGLRRYAGATIMGDGRVALILDVLGLAQRASIVTDARHQGLQEVRDAEETATEGVTRSLLLVTTPDDGRMAIDLSALSRLEEVPRSAVEYVGGQRVVQYRGAVLPLVSVEDVLDERRRAPRSGPGTRASASDESLNVLVCNHRGHAVGVVAEQIVDIVESSVENLQASTRRGARGVLVVQGRVTELIDLDAFVDVAVSRFYGASALGTPSDPDSVMAGA